MHTRPHSIAAGSWWGSRGRTSPAEAFMPPAGAVLLVQGLCGEPAACAVVDRPQLVRVLHLALLALLAALRAQVLPAARRSSAPGHHSSLSGSSTLHCFRALHAQVLPAAGCRSAQGRARPVCRWWLVCTCTFLCALLPAPALGWLLRTHADQGAGCCCKAAPEPRPAPQVPGPVHCCWDAALPGFTMDLRLRLAAAAATWAAAGTLTDPCCSLWPSATRLGSAASSSPPHLAAWMSW